MTGLTDTPQTRLKYEDDMRQPGHARERPGSLPHVKAISGRLTCSHTPELLSVMIKLRRRNLACRGVVILRWSPNRRNFA